MKAIFYSTLTSPRVFKSIVIVDSILCKFGIDLLPTLQKTKLFNAAISDHPKINWSQTSLWKDKDYFNSLDQSLKIILIKNFLEHDETSFIEKSSDSFQINKNTGFQCYALAANLKAHGHNALYNKLCDFLLKSVKNHEVDLPMYMAKFAVLDHSKAGAIINEFCSVKCFNETLQILVQKKYYREYLLFSTRSSKRVIRSDYLNSLTNSPEYATCNSVITEYFSLLHPNEKLDLLKTIVETEHLHMLRLAVGSIKNFLHFDFRWYRLASSLRKQGAECLFEKLIINARRKKRNDEKTRTGELIILGQYQDAFDILIKRDADTHGECLSKLVKSKYFPEFSEFLNFCRVHFPDNPINFTHEVLIQDIFNLEEITQKKLLKDLFVARNYKYIVVICEKYLLPNKEPDVLFHYLKSKIIVDGYKKAQESFLLYALAKNNFGFHWFELARLYSTEMPKIQSFLLKIAKSSRREISSLEIANQICLTEEIPKITDEQIKTQLVPALRILFASNNRPIIKSTLKKKFTGYPLDKLDLLSEFKFYLVDSWKEQELKKNIDAAKKDPQVSIENLSFILRECGLLEEAKSLAQASFTKESEQSKSLLVLFTDILKTQKNFLEIIKLYEENPGQQAHIRLQYLDALKFMCKNKTIIEHISNINQEWPSDKLSLWLVDYHIHTSQLSKAKEISAYWFGKNRSTQMLLRLFRCHWLLGEINELGYLLFAESTLAEDPQVFLFLNSISSSIPTFDKFIEPIYKELVRYRVLYPKRWLYILAKSGRYEEVLKATPKNQLDKLAIMLAHFYLCNFRESSAVQKELKEDGFVHQEFFEYWFSLNSYFNRSQNELFEYREQKAAWISEKIDGYNFFNDIQKMHHCFQQNNYTDAFKAKMGRHQSYFLLSKFPGRYHGFGITIEHLKKANSIFIIAEDGVGDELRWARIYKKLEKLSIPIQATCDPRFLTLFSRSFPYMKFYPVKRRWAALPGFAREKPANILSRDLENLLDKDAYDALATSDLIIVGQELNYLLLGPPKSLYHESAFIKAKSNVITSNILHNNKNKVKIGLVLSSPLVNQKRARHYFNCKDLDENIFRYQNLEFYFLSNSLNKTEIEFCERNSVNYDLPIDFYNDFEGSAALYNELDYVVGVSTLSTELAVSVGCKMLLLGLSPEAKYTRTNGKSSFDIISIGTKVLCPDSYLTDRMTMVNSLNSKLLNELGAIDGKHHANKHIKENIAFRLIQNDL